MALNMAILQKSWIENKIIIYLRKEAPLANIIILCDASWWLLKIVKQNELVMQ